MGTKPVKRRKNSLKPELDIGTLVEMAGLFAAEESGKSCKELFGVTDGKAVGTYLEHKFEGWLDDRFAYERGSSASGIDLPGLNVDIKTTSITQPQSSCPFKSARQKIYGLGYSLLVFVYEKSDDSRKKRGSLDFKHVIFVEPGRTADYQMTAGLRDIISRDANIDDIIAFFQDRNLPLDDIQVHALAEEVLSSPPELGFLTISNALQWRLQYSRVIDVAGVQNGVLRIR